MAELTGTDPIGPMAFGDSAESRRRLLEQLSERLQRRGVATPDVAAVVAAARAEAFLESEWGIGRG